VKVQVTDPFTAVRETGGCTFETELGWWTQVDSESQARALGMPMPSDRDAMYIPTLQKDGVPVPHKVVEDLKSRARKLGLTTEVCAAGMWVLSTTGEVQAETIWIFAGEVADHSAFRTLANDVQTEANQDCVAFETRGTLNFTACEPTTEA